MEDIYKGYYCSHLRLPSRQPLDAPQMVAGHMPEARARSIQSPRFQRPYLLKDSSLSPIYPVPIVSLQPPIYKIPLYLNPFYSIQKGSQLKNQNCLFISTIPYFKFYNNLNGNSINILQKAIVIKQEDNFSNKRL